jgi:hypothetical protein
MKAVEFPEVNFRIAEKQEEYETLPVCLDMSENAADAIMCFELDEDEKRQIAETGKIWLKVRTFGKPFQPIFGSVLKPENFE